ncbi:hypothetical protein FZW96_11050 [Bacillus sp. BGMRC 2118]|nr:hypothetical protein FZW96_11050 [Bacillus sp. BGMRC 2118]
MEQETIQRLISDYGPAKYVDKSIFGFKGEGWFVLDSIPLPPKEEIEIVISDIIKDHEIAYLNGKVRHWPECSNKHSILDIKVKEVLNFLEEKPFKIGVCAATDENFLGGQPIVIALNPTITYMNYPDHPHLNTGANYKGVYIPDSFCYGYTVEPDRYGPSVYEKYINVFDQATLWLLRHQVWEAIRILKGKGEWIGKHYKYGFDEPLVYAHWLSPISRCRCGKTKRYLECHLPIDIKKKVKEEAEKSERAYEEVQRNIINNLQNTWNTRIYQPHAFFLTKLIHMLK